MAAPTIKTVSVSNPTGPQFLEARICPRGELDEDTFVVLINTDKVASVTTVGSYHLNFRMADGDILMVKATVMSLKEALNFLRQTPHRGSVVLREQWDGRRKSSDDDLDALDDIIPDEEAVKV